MLNLLLLFLIVAIIVFIIRSYFKNKERDFNLNQIEKELKRKGYSNDERNARVHYAKHNYKTDASGAVDTALLTYIFSDLFDDSTDHNDNGYTTYHHSSPNSEYHSDTSSNHDSYDASSSSDSGSSDSGGSDSSSF